MARTTPPSARNAAPLVAEDSGLHTKAIRAATSAGVANRWSRDDGRVLRKKSRSTAAGSTPRAAAAEDMILSALSDAVGPGSTAFTVTLVPTVVSASPRETASCAVLVIP